MRKKTIAEKRKEEVYRLATYKRKDPTAEDIAEAKRFMNSFYRLCGLTARNALYQNLESTCNTSWLKRDEEREAEWKERLDKQCRKTYGLQIFEFASTHQSIGIKHESGGYKEVINLYFYD